MNSLTQSLSESVLLPNSTNKILSKSLIKLPKIVNSSQSITPSLAKIRSRKEKQEYQVDPYTAATVVKKYLLPMFEKSKTHQKDLDRHQLMGLGQNQGFFSRDSTAESSIFKELKLSETLLKELEDLNEKLSEVEAKVMSFEQEKFELQAEIEYLKLINSDLMINSELLSIQLNQQTKNSHSNEMKSYLIAKQLEQYKKIYQITEESLHKVSQDLHAERYTNDIRLRIYIFFNYLK
jgi:hypothetical protein